MKNGKYLQNRQRKISDIFNERLQRKASKQMFIRQPNECQWKLLVERSTEQMKQQVALKRSQDVTDNTQRQALNRAQIEDKRDKLKLLDMIYNKVHL